MHACACMCACLCMYVCESECVCVCVCGVSCSQDWKGPQKSDAAARGRLCTVLSGLKLWSLPLPAEALPTTSESLFCSIYSREQESHISSVTFSLPSGLHHHFLTLPNLFKNGYLKKCFTDIHGHPTEVVFRLGEQG